LAGFAGLDGRIRAFRQGNAGPAEARNTGFLNARGSLITFLDSDDEYLPQHLELRERYMDEHPDVDCIHGGCRVVGDPSRGSVPDLRDTSRLIPIHDCVVGATIVARAHVLRSAGGWRSGYAEDADLIARIGAAFVVRRIDFRTYLYHRDAPDSRCDAHRHAAE
jgi:glycosyltransferase involved in cell wall biosynthesis